jgi:hypothetical protein
MVSKVPKKTAEKEKMHKIRRMPLFFKRFRVGQAQSRNLIDPRVSTWREIELK